MILDFFKNFFLKIYSYVLKDIFLFYKRKKFLYLVILVPVVFSLIFLLLLSPKSYSINTLVCDFDNSELSNKIFENLKDEISFTKLDLKNEERCILEIKEKLKNKQSDLGLLIKKDFEKNLRDLKISKIEILYDNTDIAFSSLVSWRIDLLLNPYRAQIIKEVLNSFKGEVSKIDQNIILVENYLKDFEISILQNEIDNSKKNIEKLKNLDNNFLINPLLVDKTKIYENEKIIKISITYIFPIISMFILLLLSGTIFIYDFKNNFLIRVKTSRATFEYLLSKLIFFFLLNFLIFILIFLSFFVFGISYEINIFQVIKLILYSSIIYSLLGILIGLISENEGISILFSLLISLPMMLLSGIFFPLQTLSNFIKIILSYSPLHLQINYSKQVLLYGIKIEINYIFLIILFLIVWHLINRKDN